MTTMNTECEHYGPDYSCLEDREQDFCRSCLEHECASLRAALEQERQALREAREVAERNATDCAHLRQTAIWLESALAAEKAAREKAEAEVERLRADGKGWDVAFEFEKERDEARAALQAAEARVRELEARVREDNAVCLCPCPPEDHESYGEDGEACGNDCECLRVAEGVKQVVDGIRARAQTARREALEDAIKEIERPTLMKPYGMAELSTFERWESGLKERIRALLDSPEPAPREEPKVDLEKGTITCRCGAVFTSFVRMANHQELGGCQAYVYAEDQGARHKPTDAREVMKDWPDWKKGTIRAVYQRETPRTLEPTDAAKCAYCGEDFGSVANLGAHQAYDECRARTPATGEGDK